MIINSLMMMNIFDGRFKKKQQPPGPPIYGSCLSDLSIANNKERVNETQMKRLKGRRGSVSFVRQNMYEAKVKRRK